MADASVSAAEIEREIFLAALEKDLPGDRAAYLDRVCGGNLPLRTAVENLLEHHKADTFLERPVVIPPPSPPLKNGPAGTAVMVFESAGTKIGRYKLLQEIGEGACGTV